MNVKRNEKRKQQKKIKLSKANKRTKWAPVWAVIKKFGQGKRVHPSTLTSTRRSWRRTKLKIKPRKQNKPQLG
jgi:ribosomal protein L39E